MPPKSFFIGQHDNLITVPCCLKCNGASSLADDAFRVFAAAALQGEGDQQRQDWLKSAARARVRNNGLSAVRFHRSAALFSGTAPIVVASRMTRALYWHEFGERLSPTLPVISFRVSGFEAFSPTVLRGMTIREVAKGQFRYAFWRAAKEPSLSAWVFRLHSAITLVSETGVDKVWLNWMHWPQPTKLPHRHV